MSPCTTRWTSLPAEDGLLDAFVALPPAGRGPGLLLLQEIFGVNAHIRAVAEQYAQSGFVVIAPDLFRRQATRVELGYVGEDRERALTLMRGLSREQAVADMAVALAALRAMPECTGRIGALGYCMGGRLAFLAAADPGVDAAVCYYGGGIQNQLEHAARIRCPLQFHYAGRDAAIPPEAVERVREALAQRSDAPPAEFHLYAPAQHGFNCWARASYHAPSAALAHGRSLQFLAQRLMAA